MEIVHQANLIIRNYRNMPDAEMLDHYKWYYQIM